MVETVSANKRVAAAVATLVIQNNKLLLGKRFESAHFEGWQCPGGYLEQGESLEAAAQRYCQQKSGLKIADISTWHSTNNIFTEQPPVKHTVTLYLIARQYQVQNKSVFEDNKCSWCWFDISDLPEPLFLPLKLLVKEHDLSQLNQL